MANLQKAIDDAVTTFRGLTVLEKPLNRAAKMVLACLTSGHKLLVCGNGGSASDAQHLAAELVGRFRCNRSGLASLALTSNAAAVIGIANDFGFHEIFARQVDALCHPGDVVVGISTSGNSRNVSIALTRARELGATSIAITGDHGGRLGVAADVWLRIPSRDTARIQEAYMLCGHMLCEWVELATCISRAVETQRSAG